MEASSVSGGGLWNNPRASQYSKQTQDMLRLMMQESRLSNLQRKQINECLHNGTALPPACAPRSPASPPQTTTRKAVQKQLSGRPLRRSAESCRSGNSYVREKFHPGPTRDLEKEKKRLQSILATGEEEPTAASHHNVPASGNQGAAEGGGRYQEVLDEIEERRQFLADMASLGRDRQYIRIITSEISQRIRELEVLDKARSRKDMETLQRKEATAEEMAENMDLKEAEGEKYL